MKKRICCILATVFFLIAGSEDILAQTASSGTCYATRSASPYELVTIDLATGVATVIGSTGSSPLAGLAVDSDGNLYATSSGFSNLYRLDATTGSAHLIGSLGRLAVDGIAFDSNDVLYGFEDASGSGPGTLITIDTTDASTADVGGTGLWYAGLAFDPTDGTLYGSTGGLYHPDSVLTINTTTLAETFVGTTGFGKATPDIAFDASGVLYGVKGGGGGGGAVSPSTLIQIDKSTGAGTAIGSAGVSHLSGFTCYNADGGDEPLAVDIDVKPQTCPNQLNTKANSTVNVAVLGSADFDVLDVDVSSVTLNGLTPLSYEYTDISRPPASGSCTTEGADGFVDLQLKFKNPDILETLSIVADGDEFTLTLMGELNDDTEFSGGDEVEIKIPGPPLAKGSNAGPIPTSYALEQNYPNPFNPTTSIAFALPSESFVDLSIYNSIGQRVATLVSATLGAGHHAVQWDATDDLGRKVSSGLYIYRISAGEFVRSQKMLLLE